MTKPILLTTDNLVAGYGSRAVAGPASVALSPGRMTLLLGANGAGKSTLMRTLAGVQRPLRGSVCVDGRPLTSFTPRQLAREMALVYTDRTLAGALTVEETVALGRHPHTGFFGRLGSDDRRIVTESIASLGLDGMRRRHIATLSDGERQKVMIARALAQATPIIMLDEPTAFLDVASRLEVMALLGRLAHERAKAILLSTHDTGEALAVADDAWLLPGDGSLRAGDVAALIADGSLDRLFAARGVRFDPAAGDFRLL